MRTLRKLLEEFDGQAKEFQDLLRSGGNIGAFDFASAASKSGTKRTKSEDEQQAALSFTIRQMFEYGVRFFLFRGKIKMATFVYTACTMFGTNSVVARMPKATQGLMDATIGILLCKEKNRIRPGSCTKVRQTYRCDAFAPHHDQRANLAIPCCRPLRYPPTSPCTGYQPATNAACIQ